jgi:hypothetical protein
VFVHLSPLVKNSIVVGVSECVEIVSHKIIL